jgi:hypothetical protein
VLAVLATAQDQLFCFGALRDHASHEPESTNGYFHLGLSFAGCRRVAISSVVKGSTA